jgi:sulfur relay (sulfurtransferase) DsrF/TusC family protein
VYLVDACKHNPILLTLEQLVNGVAIDNLKKFIVDNVLQYGGLSKSNLVSKLISFGANGVLVFHNVKNCVTTQLKEKFPPYMLGVHRVAHWTNLAIQTLSKLPLMFKIEAMLQSIYTYYSLSPKQHLDRCKLANYLEQKALKIIYNMKTCWILMFSLAKWILIEYKIIAIQMFDEQASHDTSKVGLELLCDVEVFLGLTCIIPMLELVLGLSKFAQNQDIFICDFVVTIKKCKVQLYQMYCDQ